MYIIYIIYICVIYILYYHVVLQRMLHGYYYYNTSRALHCCSFFGWMYIFFSCVSFLCFLSLSLSLSLSPLHIIFLTIFRGVSSNRQDESPSIGLSLNRSQRGNCSTEYNTPPGT